MKVSFCIATDGPIINGQKQLSIDTEEFLFDTEWFRNTEPSINDTDKFLPEWEDATDLNWVLMYFVQECAADVFANKTNVLCKEAQEQLKRFVEMKDQIKENDENNREVRIREMVDKLKAKRRGEKD